MDDSDANYEQIKHIFWYGARFGLSENDAAVEWVGKYAEPFRRQYNNRTNKGGKMETKVIVIEGLNPTQALVEAPKTYETIKTEIDTFLTGIPAHIEILSPVSYDHVNEYTKTIKRLIKAADDTKKVVSAPYKEKITAIVQSFDGVIGPLQVLERNFKDAMLAYKEREEKLLLKQIKEQAMLVAEEQAKIDNEAREAAFKQAKLEAEADELRSAAMAETNPKLRDEIMIQAEQKERMSMENALTVQVLDKINLQPTVVIASTKGQTFVTNYTASVTNMPVFLSWIMRTGNFDLISVDLKEIERRAKKNKGEVHFDGIEITSEKDIRSRSK